MEQTYSHVLRFALNHRLLILGTTVLLLIGCLALIPLIGVELMPNTDESEVRVSGEMAVGTKLDVINNAFEKIEAVVAQAVPEIRSTVRRRPPLPAPRERSARTRR